MATRMVGGFILVAFLLCILLAWTGRRRWPVWLIRWVLRLTVRCSDPEAELSGRLVADVERLAALLTATGS